MRTRPVTRARRALFIAALLSAAAALTPAAARAESWATAQATELTHQGREHVAHGELEVAVKRYLQAIELDATYGPAYLGLGEARELGGDGGEAERAYGMGIEHVSGFAEGHLARAHLRGRQHRADDALSDLAAAAELRPVDLTILEELRGAYIAAQALPAALGVTRRMMAIAGEQRDDKVLAEARVGVRALALLLKELDPVSAGRQGRGRVRRAIAMALSTASKK